MMLCVLLSMFLIGSGFILLLAVGCYILHDLILLAVLYCLVSFVYIES
jgi:hypothetical protein